MSQAATINDAIAADPESGWEARYRLLYLIKGAYGSAKVQLDETAGAHGLTSSDYTMLSFLHRLQPCSAADLARALRITPQAATQQVGQLRAKEMVATEENSENRRISLVTMTRLGRASLQAVNAEAHRIEDAMFEGLNSEQRELVTGFLLRTMKMAQQKGWSVP
ncbi:MAG: MarR family transcriptional regulator [Sphingomicrobium sp.]